MIGLVSVALSVVVIVACGGYGGNPSSMSSGTSSQGAPSGTSGSNSGVSTTPPSMVATGAITGFGSVHLNGLRFETTSAAITVDGKGATQGDLHAGQFIQVKGHHDATRNQDVADEIDFRGNAVGTVGAVDTTAQTLVVLGQTVHVSADTSFDDDISPASLAGIQVGDFVEVSGMTVMDGSIQATRIERKPAGTSFQVIGTATSTDSMAKTLKINALVVDFSGATLVDFPASGPKDGDIVEATGTALSSGGALLAMRLELRSGKDLKPDGNGQVEVEGLISRFASSSDFDVAGRKVSTSSSTSFDGGAAGDLALNVSVEVEGTLDAAGTIAATKVEIRRPADARITGQVDSVDAANGKVVVLGIQITVDSMTRFEDHGSGKVDTFSLADVHTGDWLEVRGQAASASGTALAAARVDRVQAQSNVELMGVVASAAQPNFKILSRTVATTSATHFNHGLTAATFFANPVGKTVSVKGSWNGTVLSADDVQIGDDDDGHDGNNDNEGPGGGNDGGSNGGDNGGNGGNDGGNGGGNSGHGGGN